MSPEEHMYELRRLARNVRGRLKKRIAHIGGNWVPSVSVNNYGRPENSTLVFKLERRGDGHDGVGFTVRFAHGYQRPPTKEEIAGFSYATSRWARGNLQTRLGQMHREIPGEIDQILPFVRAAYLLAHPDKLIQMAGESEWKSISPRGAKKMAAAANPDDLAEPTHSAVCISSQQPQT